MYGTILSSVNKMIYWLLPASLSVTPASRPPVSSSKQAVVRSSKHSLSILSALICVLSFLKGCQN